MNTERTCAALDEALTIERTSFVQYLVHARPYYGPGRDDARDTIHEIVADQSQIAERLAEKLQSLGHVPTSPGFPLEYTSAHDLSIDYLLQLAAERMEQDRERLKGLAVDLALAPTAKALVDEAAGMTVGHLEALRECIERFDRSSA